MQSFYQDQCLFITGSTGFLGKAVIEILLRSLPPKRIYCLTRSNKKLLCHERLKEVFDSSLYDTLRSKISPEEFKSLKNKIRIVEGDMLYDTIVSGDVWDVEGRRVKYSPSGEEIDFEIVPKKKEKNEIKDSKDSKESKDNKDSKEKKEKQIKPKKLDQFYQPDLSWAKNITIVLHMAATVGFQETLDYALRLNTLGAYKLLRWTQKNCPSIKMFCHVSTCYVNCNQSSGSVVKEKIYPLELPGKEDYLSFAKRVSEIKDPNDIARIEKKILKKFPNTYTFSKSMAERILVQHRGSVPVCIYRPSVITASYRDPVAGWVEGLAGPGGVIVFMGLGMLTVVKGNASRISDVIPVDMASNAILASIPYSIHKREKYLSKVGKIEQNSTDLNPKDVIVYHCGTSTAPRTCTWGTVLQNALKYWQSHLPSKYIGKPSINLISNTAYYQAYHFLQYTWISKLYSIFAKMIQSDYHKKIANDLQKLETKSDFFSEVLKHFSLNEWLFRNKNTKNAWKWMSKEDQDKFPVTVPDDINWDLYIESYCYGLHKYILKEEPDPPNRVNLVIQDHKNFTTLGNRVFNDLNFAYTGTQSTFKTEKTLREMQKEVMSSTIVLKSMKHDADKYQKPFRLIENEAKNIMNNMFASPRMGYVRTGGWVLRKVWRRMYQAIYVDTKQIENLRTLYSKEVITGPVILMPTNRSYLDFAVLSYIFFAHDLPIPHVAVGEDLLTPFWRKFFRYSGAFFIKNDISSNRLYFAILKVYISLLLQQGCPVEFFVEGTRSRGGKTLHPRLDLLSLIVSSFFEKNVNNLTIVPIHIAYEKFIDQDSHKGHLLGETLKLDSSLPVMMKTKDVIFKNFGDIRVTFSKPISLVDYCNEYSKTKQTKVNKLDVSKHIFDSVGELLELKNQETDSNDSKSTESTFNPFKSKTDRRNVVSSLGYKIAKDLNQNAVIMPTALLASIILRYRSGIEFSELQGKMEWLRQEIILRGGEVHWSNQKSSKDILDRSLRIMNGLVSVSVNKNQNKIISPAVKTTLGVRDDGIFMELSFYKNQIIHLFIKEALVACAFYGLAEKDPHGGEMELSSSVRVKDLIFEVNFLFTLFSIEFTDIHDNEENILIIIKRMIKQGVLTLKNGNISDDNLSNDATLSLSRDKVENFYFLCTLVWPFIETYMMTLVALCKYGFKRKVKKGFILKYVHQNIKKLYHDQQIRFFESCSLDTIGNAIVAFENLEYIQIKNKRNKSDNEIVEIIIELSPKIQNLEDILSLSSRIKKFRREFNLSSTNLNLQHLDASPMILSKL